MVLMQKDSIFIETYREYDIYLSKEGNFYFERKGIARNYNSFTLLEVKKCIDDIGSNNNYKNKEFYYIDLINYEIKILTNDYLNTYLKKKEILIDKDIDKFPILFDKLKLIIGRLQYLKKMIESYSLQKNQAFDDYIKLNEELEIFKIK
jgi:hypothetical protein